MSKPFPRFPSDDVLAALVDEVATKQTLFGRVTGNGERELLQPGHELMEPTIGAALIETSGPCIYMPGAQPGVPEGWRTLREHELHRAEVNAGLYYVFKEYLPDVERIATELKWREEGLVEDLAHGVIGADELDAARAAIASALAAADDPGRYAGVAETTYQQAIKAVTSSLGKPKRKQKQKVEWEWGGPTAQPVIGDPTYGRLQLQFGTQKIGYPGGPNAPWSQVFFIIEVGGVPRT